jgi:monoamine oxidase
VPTLFTALKAHADRAQAEIRPGRDDANTRFALERTADVIDEPLASEISKVLQEKRPVEPNPRLSLRDRFKVVGKPDPSLHVIVIGAGFAGLSAGHELETVGYRVTVVEAQGNVGGRVESRRDIVRGKIMEGGAELIGLNHLAWWSYKNRFGLTLKKLPESDDASPVILGGRRLGSGEAAELGKQMDHAQRLISDVAKTIDSDQPWNSPDAAMLDRMSLIQGLRSIDMSDQCRLAFTEQLQTDNGVQAERQSWLGNLAMIKGGGLGKYWTDTETHHCEGGNQQLAFKFESTLGKVLLGRAVKRIDIGPKSVTVFLAKGKPLSGTDVVLAIPPSIWNLIAFDPPLPNIYKVQFGQNVKYLMNVREGCWKPDGPEMSSDGPIDLTWQGTDEGGPRVGFVAFSGANDAIKCRDWTNRKSRYLKILGSIYPNLSSSCLNGLFMDWPAKKWTLGSYSFPRPGEVMRVGPRLRSGFKGKIHFAGEHTCYAFTGYMEGALQSGLRVAERIARRDAVIV